MNRKLNNSHYARSLSILNKIPREPLVSVGCSSDFASESTPNFPYLSLLWARKHTDLSSAPSGLNTVEYWNYHIVCRLFMYQYKKYFKMRRICQSRYCVNDIYNRWSQDIYIMVHVHQPLSRTFIVLLFIFLYIWLIDWMVFYAAFNSISVISRRQFTLFTSSWVSPVLGWGSEVSCPRTLPRNLGPLD